MERKDEITQLLLRNSPINCSKAQAGANDFGATCVNLAHV